MSKLKTGVLSIGGIVVGIVTLRAFRKRQSGTDGEKDEEETFKDDGEAESSEEKDEAESLEEEDKAKPHQEGDGTPETATEHAEVAAEHALLAVEKTIKNRMEA